LDGVVWKSIEIRRADEGWCDVVLHGEAAALARRNGISDIALSMSHEHAYATATAIARRAIAAAAE
jgi:holo-[acyl-carrier protein] synthase